MKAPAHPRESFSKDTGGCGTHASRSLSSQYSIQSFSTEQQLVCIVMPVPTCNRVKSCLDFFLWNSAVSGLNLAQISAQSLPASRAQPGSQASSTRHPKQIAPIAVVALLRSFRSHQPEASITGC